MAWLFPLLYLIYLIVQERKVDNPDAMGCLQMIGALIMLVLLGWGIWHMIGWLEPAYKMLTSIVEYALDIPQGWHERGMDPEELRLWDARDKNAK